ncbi:MAG: BMP family ABC transporter substrate-binding protein [Clostridia bacterium]|nr:BMP family ABC transporter substrate-binding protein [Clostridia bacterium]
MMVMAMFAGCSKPAAEPATEPAAEPAAEATTEDATAEEAPAEDTAKVDMVMGMITDTGGLGDQSFNDSGWMGLERLEAEYGIERKVLESESADDYGPNLTSFAEAEVDIVYGVGFLFNESMAAAAAQFPNQKFAIIDSVVEADNVASITFAENEGSFLVGVIAGMTTETNKVGFIGGMKFPLIEKFEYGFKAGVKAANPDAEVISNYADSFEDAAKGKEIATVQHQQGADVIFHAAGGVGIGLIQAAEEQGFWAIGVDQDQSHISPERVLCSMIKRVDEGVYQVGQSVIDGNFEGGVHLFSIANEGVGYSDNAGNLTEEQVAAAEKWKAAIATGAFVVPQTEAEFNAFEVPEI